MSILQHVIVVILKDMVHLFFSLNSEIELFKLKPHKRFWILQSEKRFGNVYFRKSNNG